MAPQQNVPGESVGQICSGQLVVVMFALRPSVVLGHVPLKTLNIRVSFRT